MITLTYLQIAGLMAGTAIVTLVAGFVWVVWVADETTLRT